MAGPIAAFDSAMATLSQAINTTAAAAASAAAGASNMDLSQLHIDGATAAAAAAGAASAAAGLANAAMETMGTIGASLFEGSEYPIPYDNSSSGGIIGNVTGMAAAAVRMMLNSTSGTDNR